MTKQQYLNSLSKELRHVPEVERVKIIEYHGEIIDDRMEEGLSEFEAVAKMGNIQETVRKLGYEDTTVKKSANGYKIALIILIFILGFPLIITVISLLFALIVTVIALSFAALVSGIKLFVVGLFTFVATPFISLMEIFLGLFLLSSTLLIYMYIIYPLLKLTLRGLKKLFANFANWIRK